MKTLSIDIETFSDIDLGKCGVYRYTDSPNFDILLFAYSIDEGPVELVDLASGEEIPEEIVDAILSEDIIKTAFNANYERVALMRYLSRKLDKEVYLNPSSWRCSEVQAAMLGLPLHLEGVAKVLRLGVQKMSEGKPLIRYFCIPCKPTAANGGRTRNLPTDSPDKWELFKQYNIRDVEVELEIRKKIKDYPIPESEQALYELDQRINDRGFRADMDFVLQAISCDKQFTVSATERAYELTGLENPNSVSQLKDWLSERGVEVESLSKKNVKELVSETEGEVEEALELRLLMAKTSVRKYEAIERAVCSDGRVHGLFQFYGANRTGRFAGRLVQVQNLPQNHLVDLKLARNLVKEGRFEDLQMLFGNTPGVLSELIRTAFIPKEGHRFIVADFSAIEVEIKELGKVLDKIKSSKKDDLNFYKNSPKFQHELFESFIEKAMVEEDGRITFQFTSGFEWGADLDYSDYQKLEIRRKVQKWNEEKEKFLWGPEINRLLEYCKEPKSLFEMVEYLGKYKSKDAFSRNILHPLLDQGRIKRTIPERLAHKFQKYYSVNAEND
jgi:DNA polymerase